MKPLRMHECPHCGQLINLKHEFGPFQHIHPGESKCGKIQIKAKKAQTSS